MGQPSADATAQDLSLRLQQMGYVIIENLIPRKDATSMADRLMEMMSRREDADAPFQVMERLFDELDPADDELFLTLVTHPLVHSLVQSLVGNNFQMVGPGVVYRKPGCTTGLGLHADVPLPAFAEEGLPTPKDVCFMVNTIWMLTDFSHKNGATRLLPCSHRFGNVPNKWPDPETGELRYVSEEIRQFRAQLESEGDDQMVTAEAPAGSIVVFHGGMWHTPGPNLTRDEHRIGLSAGYVPRWLDTVQCPWGRKSLMTRAVRNRMPKLVQEMNRRVYENYPDK